MMVTAACFHSVFGQRPEIALLTIRKYALVTYFKCDASSTMSLMSRRIYSYAGVGWGGEYSFPVHLVRMRSAHHAHSLSLSLSLDLDPRAHARTHAHTHAHT